MCLEKREFLESSGEEEWDTFRCISHFTGKGCIQNVIIWRPWCHIKISYHHDIIEFSIRFMFLKILDKTCKLVVPHDKMAITIRRTGMHQIEIDLLSGIY